MLHKRCNIVLILGVPEKYTTTILKTPPHMDSKGKREISIMFRVNVWTDGCGGDVAWTVGRMIVQSKGEMKKHLVPTNSLKNVQR